ncbi:MAG: hypothetical protein QXI58_04260 [Candidatus Micrarchaeia archaeon]
MEKKSYWLIYSSFDLTFVIDAISKDDYYIVTEEQLQFLSELGYTFHVICEADLSDPSFKKYFSKELELGKYYPDNFSILKLDRLKLKKQTKDAYIFEHKNYRLIVNKKFYEI